MPPHSQHAGCVFVYGIRIADCTFKSICQVLITHTKTRGGFHILSLNPPPLTFDAWGVTCMLLIFIFPQLSNPVTTEVHRTGEAWGRETIPHTEAIGP